MSKEPMLRALGLSVIGVPLATVDLLKTWIPVSPIGVVARTAARPGRKSPIHLRHRSQASLPTDWHTFVLYSRRDNEPR